VAKIGPKATGKTDKPGRNGVTTTILDRPENCRKNPHTEKRGYNRKGGQFRWRM